jgi:hypothetical protein
MTKGLTVSFFYWRVREVWHAGREGVGGRTIEWEAWRRGRQVEVEVGVEVGVGVGVEGLGRALALYADADADEYDAPHS